MQIIDEEVIFSNTVMFQILPKIFLDTLISATPSVLNLTSFKSHTAATTVTNFLNGKEGQIIHILGNGNTTVSNNANIKTNTGANKVLTANKYYSFMLIENVWYEHG